MRRATIRVPEEVFQRLRRMAAERGVSLATVIREALEDKVSGHRPKPKSLGIGASGRTDISRRIGEEGFVPQPWR